MGTEFIIKSKVPYQHPTVLKPAETTVQSGKDPEARRNFGKHEQSMMSLPAGRTNKGSILQKQMEVRVRR